MIHQRLLDPLVPPVLYPPGAVKEPEAVPPHGVEHHFAPLALVTAGTAPMDLRRSFEGMAK